MKVFCLIFFVSFIFLWCTDMNNEVTYTPSDNNEQIILPNPKKTWNLTVEEALQQRRSIRSFQDSYLTMDELGQILWAAQGITDDNYKRTAPSAWATYPLEIYVAVNNVEDIHQWVYYYDNKNHELKRIVKGNVSDELTSAALGQSFVGDAAVNFIIAGKYERTTLRYSDRWKQYVHMEVGHVGQNIYLQCEALDLWTVAIGAFNDEEVRQILDVWKEKTPFYIMPVWKP